MTVLVTRAEWGARPRKQGSNNLVDNPEITIHYEGEGWLWPWDHATCDDKVRAMQAYHMDGRGWSDIAYNYLACPHGYLFEGRGWYHQSSANGYVSANEQSYALQAMWGSKANAKVPDNLKRALLYGIQVLRQHTTSKVIKGHRDWKSTDCPGDELYAWIKAGCPSPDKTEPPDNSGEKDMTTDASVRQIVNDVIKMQASTEGQPLHELVQNMAIANNEYVRQMKDDFGNFAAAATDASLKDDFASLAQKVDQINDQQGEIASRLQEILNKMNNPPA